MNYLGRRSSNFARWVSCYDCSPLSTHFHGVIENSSTMKNSERFSMGADMFFITYACLFFSQSREPAYIPPPVYLCCVNAIEFPLFWSWRRYALFVYRRYLSSREMLSLYVTPSRPLSTACSFDQQQQIFLGDARLIRVDNYSFIVRRSYGAYWNGTFVSHLHNVIGFSHAQLISLLSTIIPVYFYIQCRPLSNIHRELFIKTNHQLIEH